MAKKRKSARRTVRRRAAPRMPAPRKSSMPLHRVGHWAFMIGALIAILGGLFAPRLDDVALFTTLFALGLIVGLLNITTKETTRFLVASMALILAGVVNLGVIPGVGLTLRNILGNIVVFVVPAAVIVALRAVWLLANE
jgi:hypothetical protein